LDEPIGIGNVPAIEEGASMIRILISFAILGASLAYSQSTSAKDTDITAPDGTKLRATFFAAAKPGPGVLLLHMCNTVRKSWEPVAKELSEKGINALTIDNRGFGESGGPRFEGGTPEVRQELFQKWPPDFEAAYQFLISQPGVDRNRIALGGGSCGVTNTLKLAGSHPDVKALVLLSGETDAAGIAFIADRPTMPIFTAGAADDEYSPVTLPVMQWISEISGSPRTKFVGFKDGRHGTEIFGPHPELVHQTVGFLVDSLVTSPVDLKAKVSPRETEAAKFWKLVNEPGGAAKGAALFREKRRHDPNAFVFPEFAVNFLGYAKLEAGDKQEAIALFKLNAEAYPRSSNAQDSLSDGYLAMEQNDLALAAEQKCLELLPADQIDPGFKQQLEVQAKQKIAKLTSATK